MSKKFVNPFASQGQTSAVPEDIQPSGDVSWQEGFGADYAKDYGDPTSKDIDRQQLNKILLDTTDAIAEMQTHGVDTWSALLTYPKGALVWHGDVVYQALAISTGNAPPHADWAAIGTAATANLTTSSTDGTAGRVLKVGDGGWMSNSSVNLLTNITQAVGNTTTFAWGTDAVGFPHAAGQGLTLRRSGASDNHILLFPFQQSRMFLASSLQSTGAIISTVEVCTTGNILQTTGTSTTFPMSQKATTDALNTKANTSTQVVAGDGLSGGGNLAGNRTLSLANSHIPIGVGQSWQDVTGSRSAGVLYTNTTGRPIYISIVFYDNGNGVAQLYVAGTLVGQDDIGSTQISSTGTVSAVVPAGNAYRVVLDTSQTISNWAELR